MKIILEEIKSKAPYMWTEVKFTALIEKDEWKKIFKEGKEIEKITEESAKKLIKVLWDKQLSERI